jgi:membrane-bound lytic murein transglycosylase D
MSKAHTKARARKRGEPGGNWRLAAFGGGCTIAGSACLLLAACSTTPGKPSMPKTETVAEAPAASPVESHPVVTEPEAPATLSPWVRIRQRFALSDCDYNPAVTQWSRRFSSNAASFSDSLRTSLPFLLVVLEQLEHRDMPGEFAFLPYIESNYTALASSGDHAAGIWQLMPDTAREAGLHISREYDGRLDIYASTMTALNLLERYHEEFADWRVADMAFNAGEYGIKDLRGDNADPPSAAEVARLRVPAHTHEHLAKLLAVSCVIAEPERFHVELPEPQAEDALALLELPTAVDFGLVSRVAGVGVDQLKHLNPGYVRGRVPAAGPYQLLVPAAQRDVIVAALDRLPRTTWGEWHEIVLQQEESANVLADAYGLSSAALAAVNPHAADVALPAGTRLLVPGAGSSRHLQTAIAKVEEIVDRSSTHIVRAGDTLWSIAQRARVRLEDLLSWNDLHRESTLHLGQRLQLRPPESVASGAAAGAP